MDHEEVCMIRDYFENLLMFSEHKIPKEHLAESLDDLMKSLAKLEAFLENPNPRETMLNYTLRYYSRGAGQALSVSQLAWVEELYRQVLAVGGKGNTHVQEGLLELLAGSFHPAVLPFWLEILDYRAPKRDHFKTERLEFAMAAIAVLAMRIELAQARDALRQLAAHLDPGVRALAVYYLGEIYAYLEQELPAGIQELLHSVAANDPEFRPSFMARRALKTHGLPVPFDNPGGVYAFRVRFKRAKRLLSRTIEVRAEQALADLQEAIQYSLGWDNDHLYSFFLNGGTEDPRFEFNSPYSEEGIDAAEAIIGELGLRQNHKFDYLFDYGDSHLFEIEVVEIRPEAGRRKYPRVAEKEGKAPEQYPRWG